jgi:hypothetical protein
MRVLNQLRKYGLQILQQEFGYWRRIPVVAKSLMSF